MVRILNGNSEKVRTLGEILLFDLFMTCIKLDREQSQIGFYITRPFFFMRAQRVLSYHLV